MKSNPVGKGERLADHNGNVAKVNSPSTASTGSGPETTETRPADDDAANAASQAEDTADTADDDDASDSDQDQANKRAKRAAARAKRDKGSGPQVIEIRPMATKAQMRKRHWGLLTAFIIMVVIPISGIGYYLTNIATDQYASDAGFSVRKEDVGTPGVELMGGLSNFLGGSTSAGEADMLYEFIQSQNLVAKLDERLDLHAHYTVPYEDDPIFGLKPGGTIEDLTDYWHRIVKVSFDQGTGLISLHVRAFTPEMSARLSEEIIRESQDLINELNANARADMLKYAEQDLAEAVARLKQAREALVNFRTRTQIVDPQSDLAGRMGVLNSLQQQLAQALIDFDIVTQDAVADDPRVTSAQRRIEVIRARINDERRTLSDEEVDGGDEAYPALLAEYESLVVDSEFAGEAYRTALASLDIARANAARQSRYLATYLKPTVPERSDYPQRGVIFGLSTLFLVLFWSIASLMYYAFRDRK